jgi:hypothetical protein
MAQSFDMPVAAFESLDKAANLLHVRQIGDRILGTEVFTGERARDVHEAMDARRSQIEAAGGSVIHRTRIGRNVSCPCGSGLKFKKCCIDKAAFAG